MSGPHILMVAGEASGDLHGSRLAAELRRQSPNCRLEGIGGQKMAAAGVNLIYTLQDFAFLGFSEVLKHLPFVLKVLRQINHLLEMSRPDLVILIDYPGFNIRLAKMAKKKNIPVLYYISPQVWAWQPHRARIIAKWVDCLVVILPFERNFYRRRTRLLPVFVGHPLLEVVGSDASREVFCRQWGLDPERPILGLLPGSRKQEVGRLLPIMLTAGRLLQRRMPQLQLTIGAISPLSMDLYRELTRKHGAQARLVENASYDLMHHARLLLVASGTATLEAAIMGTPMVILYRISWSSWLLALLLIRVRHIGLVNLVAGEKIVPELIQHQVTTSRVARKAFALLEEDTERREMLQKLSTIRHRLGTEGASRRTAELALGLIANKG